jgi:hypothetical protein
MRRSAGEGAVPQRATVPCPYCAVLTSRSHQERCSKRIVTCHDCGMQLNAASAEPHKSVCPSMQVPCPGCGFKESFATLRQHVLACSSSFQCLDCGEAFRNGFEFAAHAMPRCQRTAVTCHLCCSVVMATDLAEHYVDCSRRFLTQKNHRESPRNPKKTHHPVSARASAKHSAGSVVEVSQLTPWDTSLDSQQQLHQRVVSPMQCNPKQFATLFVSPKDAPLHASASVSPAHTVRTKLSALDASERKDRVKTSKSPSNPTLEAARSAATPSRTERSLTPRRARSVETAEEKETRLAMLSACIRSKQLSNRVKSAIPSVPSLPESFLSPL